MVNRYVEVDGVLVVARDRSRMRMFVDSMRALFNAIALDMSELLVIRS